jgi:hypothetical protein
MKITLYITNTISLYARLTQVATFQVIKSCKSVKSIFTNSDLCTTNFRLVKGSGL